VPERLPLPEEGGASVSPWYYQAKLGRNSARARRVS